MFSLTIKSIRAKKVRFALTSIAVVLGVAFMVGTMVLTQTIKASYARIVDDVYSSTDAVVRSERTIQGKNDATEVRGTVGADVLARVRATDGVAAAEGRIQGVAAVLGPDGRLIDSSANRSTPIALGWMDTPALNPMDVVAGHPPRAPDDVVIDRATRRAGGFAVGDAVRVVGPTGSATYRLVGVVTYGGADDAAGAPVVAFTPDTAAAVLGTPGRYSAVQVVAEPGVSDAELVARLRGSVASDSVGVLTGSEAAAEARKTAGSSLEFMSVFLMTFAVTAVVVGAFVIHNTFSITVAQRTREHALLRALGARRGQITRSVLLEAVATGAFAATVGVGVGIGVAEGLRWVLESFGLNLPASGLVVPPGAIVIAIVVGVVTTVVAAYIPAHKAAKVAPIEALRDAAHEAGPGGPRRTVTGAIVLAVGVAGVAIGLSGGNGGAFALGALAVFVGTSVVGPAMVGPFARTVARPFTANRSITGTLARENAVRNPRRTAATASALMIGIALVALITVFAASTRASVSSQIDTAMKGDYIVTTQYGMGGVSPEVAERIDALPETAWVTSLRYGSAASDGVTKDISAVDPATVERTVYTNVRAGSFDQLGADGVAVYEKEAESRGLSVGDPVTLDFPETGARDLRVVAIYGTHVPLGDYVVSIETFAANIAANVDDDVVVATAQGVSMAEARRAIDGVLVDYPTADLLTRDEFKGSIAAEIQSMLNLIYVLLAMALVIAFFGIANTLALSVFERTRELGLLRAVGMARSQVRSVVRREAVIVALLGASIGTVLGIGFSWALVQALRDQGFGEWVVPVGSLAVIVVLSAAVAVLAAALPARRAARLDVLAAIGG
jgi:putative ABC transport system permease protein